jgi:hypothetical protein
MSLFIILAAARWGVPSLSHPASAHFDDANLFLTSRFDAN